MRILAITGGHSFDRAAFADLLDALPGEVTWREHPDAAIGPDDLADHDVSLHYDMPGTLPEPYDPPESLRDCLRAARETGHGYVVLHHAIASWATWDEWSEFVGGRYLYQPGTVPGGPRPDSGYRHAVEQRITIEDSTHPVTADLPAHLDLVDETYLCEVFEDSVTPLLRTNAPMTDDVHFSTALAMSGRRDEREGWQHAEGSSLVGWCRTNGASRLVYLQPGDTAATLAHPDYRSLIANSLRWAARSI